MEEAKKRINTAETEAKKILDLSDLNLDTCPEIPEQITFLILNNNNLTQLPKLPPNLSDLYVDNNQITVITDLPENLELLSCVNNNLSKLEDLPDTLQILDCRNNYFKSEPDVPKHCKLFIHPSKVYATKKNNMNNNNNSAKNIKEISVKAVSESPVKPVSQTPVAQTPVHTVSANKFPELQVPAGSENSISLNDIETGDHLVDFDGEASHQRYYLKSTYDKLMKTSGKNPQTRNPIRNAKNYTAKIKKGGRRLSKKNSRS